MQVEQLCTLSGSAASNDQLLRMVETDMLLGLAVHQLTASIPVSYPGAKVVGELASKLLYYALFALWEKISMHQLPLPAAYTGPQLALQVMRSPLGPSLLQQQQQQQQEPQQQQYYTVAPSSQLLTELLPLLTSYGLSRVQQECARREQLLGALQQQLQQGGGGGQAAGLKEPSVETLETAIRYVCAPDVMACILHMQALLCSAVVPDPNLTAAEVQAAAAAAAAVQATVEPGSAVASGSATYRCVLHTPATVMQHAGGIVGVWEALLREAAAVYETAAWVDGRKQVAAEAGGATMEQLPASCIASFERNLMFFADTSFSMTGHKVFGGYPHQPSALVLTALSAGPGSDLQQQLFSLLCTMVKLGNTPVSSAAAPSVSRDTSIGFRIRLVAAAASPAAALLIGEAGVDQPDPGPVAGSSDRHAAVASSRLPSLFILGRCCMFCPVCSYWAQQLRPGDIEMQRFLQVLTQNPEEPIFAEHLLPPVQQWLQASITQEQPVAVGFAPQALPQQLQQMLAALKAMRDSTTDSQLDTVGCQAAAAQQVQAAGSALCSFATPCLCNNPACVNMSGLTEVGLVSGRSCVCGGCRVARYCGRACQRAMWKQHKPVCAALAAASSAPAAGAAGVSSYVAVPLPLTS
jgi:hypothetical protein